MEPSAILFLLLLVGVAAFVLWSKTAVQQRLIRLGQKYGWTYQPTPGKTHQFTGKTPTGQSWTLTSYAGSGRLTIWECTDVRWASGPLLIFGDNEPADLLSGPIGSPGGMGQTVSDWVVRSVAQLDLHPQQSLAALEGGTRPFRQRYQLKGTDETAVQAWLTPTVEAVFLNWHDQQNNHLILQLSQSGLRLLDQSVADPSRWQALVKAGAHLAAQMTPTLTEQPDEI